MPVPGEVRAACCTGKAVTRAIQALDAHAHVVIDRAHDRVEVDTTRDAQQVADAIREEGYQVTH